MNKKERKLAILKDNDEDWLRIYTPYSRNFIDYLKMSIAPQDREPVFRESAGKQRFGCWRIRRTYLQDIYKLMTDFWPNEAIVSDLEDDDWVDQLFAVVPDAKLDIVYRALSQAFHPDVGGDEATMKRVNLAYQMRKKPEQFWE